jgi:hypothetical protein
MGRVKYIIESTNKSNVDFPCGFHLCCNVKSKISFIKLHKKNCEICKKDEVDHITQFHFTDYSKKFSKDDVSKYNQPINADLLL